MQAYARWHGRTPTPAELAEYEAEGHQRRRDLENATREYHLIETGGTTRDAVAADDAHCRGETVHYRDHGPHDETPGPWRVYGTANYVDEAR